MEVNFQLHESGKEPSGTDWMGGWVCPKAGLDAAEKKISFPLPEIELRPSSP
jgi:hypothetical protein